MAAAFYNQLNGGGAVSAGTNPADSIHPVVAAAMLEEGVDLSKSKPQKLTEELAANADLLITMGCGEKCPFVPGLKVIDWTLPDPKGKPIEEVRAIRDDIKHRVRHLISHCT